MFKKDDLKIYVEGYINIAGKLLALKRVEEQNWQVDLVNKYRNKKIKINGQEFDSQLEYMRYCQLKILERAKEIKDLQRQVIFELQPKYKKGNKTIRAINYIADFVYIDAETGQKIIEDTKGFKNDVYKLKKKLFEYIYKDLEIREIRKEDL